jgi:hypothetical protein
MKRHADGTWRGPNQARKMTARGLVARWVEAETMKLKQAGMSLEESAGHITAVGQGKQAPLVAPPDELEFPDGYRISAQGVHRAFSRAITRLPNSGAEAYRKLDSERCEALFLALQVGIRKGDVRSVEVGVRVLEHKARLNAYLGATKVELDGRNGGISVRVLQQAVEALKDETSR